jgi:hypothetical protein
VSCVTAWGSRLMSALSAALPCPLAGVEDHALLGRRPSTS